VLAKPFLSIIIPAYNEERRLPETLDKIEKFLAVQLYSGEVFIVENGSTDRTLEIANAFASDHPFFYVLSEEQRGKGSAVRRGMLEANGAYRFMCDADLSMPVEEINYFLPPHLEDFDVAIASREAPGSVRYHEPIYRHLGGRAVNAMIRLMALPGLHDTQCGFKCFPSAVAEDLFKQQTLTGWSFDIEILFVARRRHYRIVEVPIHWFYNPESKLNTVKDAIKMGVDILKIWWNFLQRRYQPLVSTSAEYSHNESNNEIRS
jgi:dolichyl-phosphate beta-glucosyltransferase